MITAVIRKGEDTLVLDFPRGISDLRVKLLSIGILTPPDEITLFGDDKHGIDVQIASDSEFGQHLCRLFCENNTLADVNTATWLVKHADESFASDLENDVIYDQYSHANELIADIRKRTEEAGFVIYAICQYTKKTESNLRLFYLLMFFKIFQIIYPKKCPKVSISSERLLHRAYHKI